MIMKNSVLWWGYMRQTDGHSQVHSGHEGVNPPGASPDQQEPLTVAEDPVFTSRTTVFHAAARLSKRSMGRPKQRVQFLPDTPCAPHFLNLHLWIPKLHYCSGDFSINDCKKLSSFRKFFHYITWQPLYLHPSTASDPFFLPPVSVHRSIFHSSWNAEHLGV